jgi:hypothetical protein
MRRPRRVKSIADFPFALTQRGPFAYELDFMRFLPATITDSPENVAWPFEQKYGLEAMPLCAIASSL